MTATTTRTCDACGSVIYPTVNDCQSCEFWAFQFATPGGFIVGGHHYRIEEEPSAEDLAAYRRFYGSNGHEFRIRFADGREVVTHNLMAQGQIPLGLVRPDNAEFMEEIR